MDMSEKEGSAEDTDQVEGQAPQGPRGEVTSDPPWPLTLKLSEGCEGCSDRQAAARANLEAASRIKPPLRGTVPPF